MRNYIYSLAIILTIVVGYITLNKNESVIDKVVVAINSVVDDAVPANSHTSTMLFVGDIMLSRSVGALMQKKNDYDFPFEKVANILKQADLAIVNLENPVSTRGIKVGSIYSFRADPKVMQGLQYAGIDIVNIANNHIWDYGRDAFVDTLGYIKTAGINYIGGGNNFSDAHDAVIKDVRGTKIAFLGYTDLISAKVAATNTSAGVAYLDENLMIADIEKAVSLSDMVVVSFHWGEEYETIHNLKQETIAKKAIDAGASLVVGHHPHVRQDIQRYKDAWIAYSLGNFIFDQSFSKETMSGLLLEVIVKDKKIESVDRKEITISDEYQPSLVDLK